MKINDPIEATIALHSPTKYNAGSMGTRFQKPHKTARTTPVAPSNDFPQKLREYIAKQPKAPITLPRVRWMEQPHGLEN